MSGVQIPSVQPFHELKVGAIWKTWHNGLCIMSDEDIGIGILRITKLKKNFFASAHYM